MLCLIELNAFSSNMQLGQVPSEIIEFSEVRKLVDVESIRTHICTLPVDRQDARGNLWTKLKRKYQSLILISLSNRYSLSFFRSKNAVEFERQRQLKKYHTTIHPFSKFRVWYDFYLFFLYTFVVINSPTEGAFIDHRSYNTDVYKYFCLITDFLCLHDMLINFRSGYIIKTLRVIELAPKKIARRYLFGPFFVFDLLSSIPKSMLHSSSLNSSSFVFIILDVCCMLKIVRIVTIVEITERIVIYKGFRMNTLMVMIRATFIACIAIHYFACVHYILPRIIQKKFFQGSFMTNYVHCFFRSSAYMLNVRLDTKKFEPQYPEEYVLAIISYIAGKMVVAAIWIILVSFILDSRSAAINYRATMNQVEAYLSNRQVPLEVCTKINQYYNFKYKNVHFKEENINMLLSARLKKEIQLCSHRSLLERIPLLSLLTIEEFKKIQSHFEYEILGPNATVFHSGSVARHMYFLVSGTVAVYTHSGKEVYHLKDGAYFGEISLLLVNKRQVTVVTLEFCELIKLGRECFKRYMLKNTQIARHMLYWAEFKFQDISLAEQKYKYTYM